MVYIFWAMLIKGRLPRKGHTPEQRSEQRIEQVEADKSVTSYRPIPLLTNYEQLNYVKLREYAQRNGLIICPKIRLADLIEPKPNKVRAVWQKHFNMICSKHVDFTLCDYDLNVKVIIELDDKSHQRQDRQIRDRFVDTVLKSKAPQGQSPPCGLPGPTTGFAKEAALPSVLQFLERAAVKSSACLPTPVSRARIHSGIPALARSPSRGHLERSLD